MFANSKKKRKGRSNETWMEEINKILTVRVKGLQ